MSWTTADLERKGFHIKKEGANLIAEKTYNPKATYVRGNENSFVLDVLPCPKPRMTRSDKWNKRPCVLKYRSFCDDLRAAAEQINFQLPDSNFHITFYLPIPKSHLKRELESKPHQQKPDVDNLVKAVFDAMNKADQSIYDFRASKYYSSHPRITFERIS